MTDITIVTGTDGVEYRIPVAAIDAIAGESDNAMRYRERVEDIAHEWECRAKEAELERDELRAQLANAAASEVDAVQGRQECEAELREARAATDQITEAFLRMKSDRDKAKQRLRQLREALERQEQTDGLLNLSGNVRDAMQDALEYLLEDADV